MPFGIASVACDQDPLTRLATSVGGVLTGRGADIIVIDDPLKPEEALSQAQRRSANEWFDHTLYSRLNDKEKGAIVLIMHRLHESLPLGRDPGDDLVGHVLAQEDWEVVRFPAIDQVDSTAQMLDWFKRGSAPSSNAGIFELYRMRAEEARRQQAAGERRVRLRVP